MVLNIPKKATDGQVLVPAAAVIPTSVAYANIVAVKKLVVGFYVFGLYDC